MYKKENHSLDRINKGLIQVISQWIHFNRDLDKRLLTLRIDNIYTSKDLSCAKIFIYHDDKPNELAKILNKKAHPIHQYIFKHLKIRRVPKIKFLITSKQSPEQELISILDEIDCT